MYHTALSALGGLLIGVVAAVGMISVSTALGLIIALDAATLGFVVEHRGRIAAVEAEVDAWEAQK